MHRTRIPQLFGLLNNTKFYPNVWRNRTCQSCIVFRRSSSASLQPVPVSEISEPEPATNLPELEQSQQEQDFRKAFEEKYNSIQKGIAHIQRFVFKYTSPEEVFRKVVSALSSPGTTIIEDTNNTHHLIDPELLQKDQNVSVKLVFNPNNISMIRVDDPHIPEYITEPLNIISSIYGNGLAVDRFGWIHIIRGTNVGDIVVAKVQASVSGCCKSVLVEILDPESLPEQKFLNPRSTLSSANSEDREVPRCKYFRTCSGCQFQHVSYASELQSKQKYVQNILLKHSESLCTAPDQMKQLTKFPVIADRTIYGYREEVEAEVPPLKPGEVLSRISIRGSEGPFSLVKDELGDMDSCSILHPILEEGYVSFRERWMGKVNITDMDVYKQHVRFRKTLKLPAGQVRNLEGEEEDEEQEQIKSFRQMTKRRAQVWEDYKKEHSEKVSKLKDAASDKGSDNASTSPIDVKHASKDEILNAAGLAWREQTVKGNDSIVREVGHKTFVVPAEFYTSNSPWSSLAMAMYVRYALKLVREEYGEHVTKNLLVPKAEYGFWPVHLAHDVENVSSLHKTLHSLSATERNLALNDVSTRVRLNILDPVHSFDIPRHIHSIGFISSETTVVLEPGRRGHSVSMLRNLVQFGPKVIVYVSDQLNSLHLSDLTYLTGGPIDPQKINRSFGTFASRRTETLFERSVEKRFNNFVPNLAEYRLIRRDLMNDRQRLERNAWADIPGPKARKNMERRIRWSHSQNLRTDGKVKKQHPPLPEDLTDFCTPGATYKLHSVRTFDTAPRTAMCTTIFVLVRNR